MSAAARVTRIPLKTGDEVRPARVQVKREWTSSAGRHEIKLIAYLTLAFPRSAEIDTIVQVAKELLSSEALPYMTSGVNTLVRKELVEHHELSLETDDRTDDHDALSVQSGRTAATRAGGSPGVGKAFSRTGDFGDIRLRANFKLDEVDQDADGQAIAEAVNQLVVQKFCGLMNQISSDADGTVKDLIQTRLTAGRGSARSARSVRRFAHVNGPPLNRRTVSPAAAPAEPSQAEIDGVWAIMKSGGQVQVPVGQYMPILRSIAEQKLPKITFFDGEGLDLAGKLAAMKELVGRLDEDPRESYRCFLYVVANIATVNGLDAKELAQAIAPSLCFTDPQPKTQLVVETLAEYIVEFQEGQE